MIATKILNVIIILIIILFTTSYGDDNALKYYSMGKTFNSAVLEYNRDNILIAKDLFNAISKADSFNYYWESEIYLANLYLRFGFPDSAKQVIDQSIIKDAFCSLGAKKNLLVAKEALKKNRSIEIDSLYTYEDIYEALFGPFMINSWGDVPPEPINGFEKYESYLRTIILDSLNSKIVNENVYIEITINYHGIVGRVKVHDIEGLNINDNEKLFHALYKSRWKSGYCKNEPKGWSLIFSVDLGAN